MRAVLKTLRENSPCKLSGRPRLRVLPGEGKEEVESGCKGTVKKASFRSRTVSRRGQEGR